MQDPDPTRDTTGAAAQPTDGFDDAAEFFDGPLVLPIRGKTYTIPEPDIELGLAIAGITAGQKVKQFEGKPVHYLYRALLGPVWDQLEADGVPGIIINRVGETAMVDFTQGRELAKLVWKHGVSPELLAATKMAAAPQQEIPASLTASKRSSSTAAAGKTPSRASTRATSSRTATRRTPAKKAAPKAGR